MQIVEVKNNLVKINYDTVQENLILSGFVVIKDEIQSFIGQIIHLESNPKGNFAIIKLIFTFNDEGVISTYNGAIPNVECAVESVSSSELLELLPIKTPILFGELAQQNTKLNLDLSVFENKLLVCCENKQDNDLLIRNFVSQLLNNGKKLLVIDLNADLNLASDKITASKNFKLPLNYDSINFIYSQLEDAAAETKALIQEVFLEVQNYVKTLPEQFIPFETFKEVVDSQYEEMDLVELLLLKNRLLKFYEDGVFAQEKSEFNSLENSLKNKQLTVLDLSKVEDQIQREMVAYAYSIMNQLDDEYYVFLNIENDNSDKKLLKKIFTSPKIFSTIICNYSYKYLNELKQLSKTSIFFTPIQQQNDFAIYNVFLSKLNLHEYIVYGQATHNMPLIVQLTEEGKDNEQIANSKWQIEEEIEEEVSQSETDDNLSPVHPFTYSTQDELTDEDLDFIDDLGITEEVKGKREKEKDNEQIANSKWQIEEEKGTREWEIEEVSQSETDNLSTIRPFDLSPQEPPPEIDILPADLATTPIVPIYSAQVEPLVQSDELEQGDVITHVKYGKGTVEKMISYGSKTLCSINFDNVGRRLLDPNLAELKKV